MTQRAEIIREKEAFVAKYVALTSVPHDVAQGVARILADRAITLGQVGTISSLELTRHFQRHYLKMAQQQGHKPDYIIQNLPRTISDIAVLKMTGIVLDHGPVSGKELEALKSTCINLRAN